MSALNIKIHNFTGLDGLSSCRLEWQEIYRRSGSENPFLTWEWTYYWASNYAVSERIKIFIAEQDGVPVALAPLSINKRTLTFLVDPLFADYADFIFLNENPIALEYLINYCFALGEKAKFYPMREIGSTAGSIAKSARSLKRQILVEKLSENPCVKPLADFGKYMGERSKRLRQEIRTTINHLNRDGGWEFIESKDNSESDAIIDSLFSYHQGRQSDKKGISIFDSSKNRIFFKLLHEKLSQGPAQAYISGIKWQGRFVSSAYCLVSGKTLFYWIPSFDNRIMGVSLGKLHIKCLLERCFSDGLTFDFMGGVNHININGQTIVTTI